MGYTGSRYQIDNGETGLDVRNGLNTFLTQTYDFMDLNDAATLEGQAGSYYLDWNNFTNTPTTIAGYGIADAFDGQYNSLIGIPTDVTDLSLHTTDELVEGSTNLYLTSQAQDIYGVKSFQNDTIFYGNITQAGTGTIVFSDTLRVKDTLIYTRDGATIALGAGEYTGIQAINYDGTNDGQLVFDKDGWARVGDVGNLQKLATIEETSNSYALSFYNTTTNRLETHQNFKITPFTSTALGSLDIWTDAFRISDTEGVEQVLLESSGMKINADLNLSGKVLIYNLTTGFIPYHQSDSVGLEDSIIFQNSNGIGIGTANPSNALSVQSEMDFMYNNERRVTFGYNSSSGYANLFLLDTLNGLKMGFDSNQNAITLKQSGNIGIGTATPYQNLSIGQMRNEGQGLGILGVKTLENGYAIHVEESNGAESWQIGVNSDGDLNFFDSGSSSSKVTIQDQTGNFGLGIITPIEKLDVDGNIKGNARIISDNNIVRIVMGSNSTLSGYLQGYETGGSSVKDIRIQPSGGNVIIGNGTPTEKLDVAGNINATGIYKLNGSEFHKVTVNATAPSSPSTGDIWIQP